MTFMLSIGKLGAQAFQTKIDVGANNIANSTTNGYNICSGSERIL